MPKQVLSEMERKMKAAIDNLISELGVLRTGRATPALLDRIVVEYYGTPTPLNQMANISAPDPRSLLVAPWDKSITDSIVAAIGKSPQGWQATKDGNDVRINVPPLNEERRREMVKQSSKDAEAAKIAVRNVRRDANDTLKKMEKDGELTKDDISRYEGEVQKITDRYINEVDAVREAKESEIMEV